MLTLKRKNLVLGMLVVLLVITGYLNFVYNQNALDDKNKNVSDNMANKPKVTINDSSNDIDNSSENSSEETLSNSTNIGQSGGFFVEYRFERENARKEEVTYIKEIVDNPKSETETKNEAQAQLLELTNNIERELKIEGLLKAKGFEDSIVMFNQDFVNVIIGKIELAPEEVAQILDIVKRESGKTAEYIRIIPTDR